MYNMEYVYIYTNHVTVKTFPKIGAFFCKGLPAYMHIVPAFLFGIVKI